MNICRHYQQGYCRYGNRCKFLHPTNNDYSYGYSDNSYYGDDYNSKSRQQKGYSGGSNNSNYRNDHIDPRYKGSQSSSSNQTTHDLWSLIEKELKVLEEGHQWPLTCFSISREYGNMPGWEDHSPEELRHEVYKAIKDGTFEQCKISIAQLYKLAEERRNDFKSKARALPILEALIQNRDTLEKQNSNVSTQDQNTNLWQNKGVNQQTANLFGGSNSSQPTSGIFGGNNSSAQAPTGIFGGNSSAVQAATGIFGGNINSQQTSGIFGGNSSPMQPATGIFGGSSGTSQSATGIFGGNNSANQSVFGGATPQATGIFGGTPQTTGIFGGTPQPTGIFGGNNTPTPQSTGIFGGNVSTQQTTGIFGGNNVFGSNQISFNSVQEQQLNTGANPISSSMFPAASPFQSQNTSTFSQQSSQMTSSPFNNPDNSAQPSSNAAVSCSIELTNYSQQADLSESDLEMFQAKAFKFGQIPLIPPPKEVC